MGKYLTVNEFSHLRKIPHLEVIIEFCSRLNESMCEKQFQQCPKHSTPLESLAIIFVIFMSGEPQNVVGVKTCKDLSDSSV